MIPIGKVKVTFSNEKCQIEFTLDKDVKDPYVYF